MESSFILTKVKYNYLNSSEKQIPIGPKKYASYDSIVILLDEI